MAFVTMAFAQEREAHIPEAPFETFEEMRLSDLASETGYAEVNGLKMYYEIHGEGAPLVVMHGGFMNIDDIDWREGVSRFHGPALVVIADTDFLSPEHAAELARLMGGGSVDGGMGPSPATQLAVLPGTTHFDILYRTDLLLPALATFLREAGAAQH